MKKNICFTAIFGLFLVILASCYTPSPIYGTWADNAGNKITFVDDGSYSATVLDSTNTKVFYSGTWVVNGNVLVFSKNNGTSINTEWDLRGSILYLDWTDDEANTKSLSLYHVSK
ncbi:hypothetical protein [Treponema sp.]|uniref:hypothetical protein n=1 Tax=Treponema sp. TaxID=166 RepID=UPI00388DDEA6